MATARRVSVTVLYAAVFLPSIFISHLAVASNVDSVPAQQHHYYLTNNGPGVVSVSSARRVAFRGRSLADAWQDDRLKRARSFTRTYLALCVCAVDEADIVEWVEYHKRMGVGRIYVLDQLSHPPMFGLLWDYIESGFVVYNYITNPGKIQRNVYELCVQWYGPWHRWMGFIDMDEFLVIPSGQGIDQVLKSYEEFNGVALNWRIIGSSGLVERPAAGVLKSYSSCFKSGDPRGRVKLIANPAKIKDFTNPHFALYTDGGTAVSTDKKPVNESANIPALLDVMYLNHYMSKSFADWRMKVLRKRNTYTPNFMGDFYNLNNLTTDNCSLLPMPGPSWSPPHSVTAYAAQVEALFPCQKFGDVETIKGLPTNCSDEKTNSVLFLGDVQPGEVAMTALGDPSISVQGQFRSAKEGLLDESPSELVETYAYIFFVLVVMYFVFSVFRLLFKYTRCSSVAFWDTSEHRNTLVLTHGRPLP